MTIGIEPFLLYQQTIIYKNPFHDSTNEISINNRTKNPTHNRTNVPIVPIASFRLLLIMTSIGIWKARMPTERT